MTTSMSVSLVFGCLVLLAVLGCLAALAAQPTPLPTPSPTPRPTATPDGPVCECSRNRYNCPDFPLPDGTTAQACFDYCWHVTGKDVHRLDADKDGLACERD